MTNTRPTLRRRHLWAVVALALVWIFSSLGSIEPFDFWWNVTSGRWMVQHGQFLATDVLVFSPVREPYSNPQWGAQLLFYVLYAAWPGLLLAARATIMTATYAVLYALCRRRSLSPGWSAVAVLVAFITGLTNYGMRPQLFAFLPFVLFLSLLERKDTHPRGLWALAPIMVVWVNVHGSYFLGWGLLGLYALATLLERGGTREGRAWLRARWPRRELLPMAVGAVAAFLNPYGLGIVQYFFIATNDATARSLNVEWQPPTLYNGTGILFFANAALFAALLLASRRTVGWREGLLLAAFGYLALVSIRNVLWWGWVTAPGLAASGAVLAARLLPRSDPEAEPVPSADIPALNWLIAGAFLVVSLIVAPLWRTPEKALDKTTPVALAAWLAAQPPHGQVFNYMEWGGYLEWVLYPGRQLFIDGRFEARRPQVWDDYLAISRGAGDWQARLDRYAIGTLVLNRSFHSTLVPLVEASPQWQRVYPTPSDPNDPAVVFYRR
ncbi:MAG TPA: hypothetical protein VM536_10195 [Chloroflexia bacterium]|nr:hypothetical protein [Chloroflexia bacterium]